MEFNEYQEKAWGTAIYPDRGKNIIYPALWIGGESGEILNKIKKISRDEKNILNSEKKAELIKELGDLLWYIAALATELKINMNDIAEKNIVNLGERKNKGTLHGSGDNR